MKNKEAVRCGDIDEIKRLIEAGADVNAQTNYVITALMVISVMRHKEIVKLLIEAGVKEY